MDGLEARRLVLRYGARLGLTSDRLYIARRRGATRAHAVNAWTQATCPVCLTLGSLVAQHADPAVRWEGAA
jgi:hypothetical protein